MANSTINWEIITGISSVVVALCALLFTVWQVLLSRTHNKITTTPNLSTFVRRVAFNDSNRFVVALDVINNGLGPAFIKKFAIHEEGNELTIKNSEQLEEKIREVLGIDNLNIDATVLVKNHSIAKGEKQNIVKVDVLDLDKKERNSALERLEKLNLHITYSSAYGEKGYVSTDENEEDIPILKHLKK